MRYKSADRSDPLTNRGRCQAEQLGKELSSTHIDRLISSPYLRALDTARAIGRNNTERPDLKPDEDELIIEQDHGPEVDAARTSGNGDLELQLRTGLSPLASFEFHGAPPRSYCPPGGESLESVTQRARTALLPVIYAHMVQVLPRCQTRWICATVFLMLWSSAIISSLPNFTKLCCSS